MHVSNVLSIADWQVINSHDLLEDRQSQIGYSLIGHHEKLDTKRAFDPDSLRRVNILARVPFPSSVVDVKIGGTTCFDYFKKADSKSRLYFDFAPLYPPLFTPLPKPKNPWFQRRIHIHCNGAFRGEFTL